jgi:hypothetical protein
MTYLTIRATVRQGRVELLDNITLREEAELLVTVLDDALPEKYSLGDHLSAGLQDILLGRVVEISNEQDLSLHLDALFGKD